MINGINELVPERGGDGQKNGINELVPERRGGRTKKCEKISKEGRERGREGKGGRERGEGR